MVLIYIVGNKYCSGDAIEDVCTGPMDFGIETKSCMLHCLDSIQSHDPVYCLSSSKSEGS